MEALSTTSTGRKCLLATSAILLLIAPAVEASYTVVDSGSSAVFAAPTANAVSYAWTLDGVPVGSGSNSFTYSPDVNAVGTHDLIVNQTLMTGGTASAEWGVRVRIPIPTSSIQFYVSSTAAANGDGSAGSPFNTLEAAQNAIRQLSQPLPPGGVTVYLSGTFYRNSTLTLTGSDSGSSLSAPVIWSSGTAPAVITCGTRVSGTMWSQLASSEWSRLAPGVSGSCVWEADIAALGLTHKGPFPTLFNEWPIYNANGSGSGGVFDLFYNGTRMWMSRYPNHNLSDDSQTPNMWMDGVALDISGSNYLNASGTYLTSGTYVTASGSFAFVSGTALAVGGAFKYYTSGTYGNPSDGFPNVSGTETAAHVARWSTAFAKGGVWLQGYWRVSWQINGLQVLGVDYGNKVIMLAPGATPSGNIGAKYSPPVGSKQEPFWVMNLLEEMDQPGEWCIDFNRNKIYFLMSTPGVPPADNSVVVADMGTPAIQITGSNIVVKGITFDTNLGEGVQVLGGSRNLVAGCTFRNFGSPAVDLNNSSGGSYNGVVSCDFSHMGSAGVILGGGNYASNPRVPTNDYVVNNTIQSFSELVRVYTPAVNIGFTGYTGKPVGMRVAHNAACGSPHVGLLWGGFDHQIEYNDIGKYGQFSNDMGGIYTFGSNYVSNAIIRYNYLHDSPHDEGVYFDSDHINATVFGNVANLKTLSGESRGTGFYDQTLQNGAAADPTIPITDFRYNNIAVNCHTGFQFYSGTGGTLESNASYLNTTDYKWNLVSVSGTSYSVSSSTQSALASGTNTTYASDPGFMNFAADDLRLRPDSRIYADMPKYRKIPFEMIGLYNDEFRSGIAVHSPFVSSAAPSPAPGASFTANGVLTYPEFDGGADVVVYWGPQDGGTNAASWQNDLDLGTQGSGQVSGTLSGLSASGTYYYRFYAVNSSGSSWATNSTTVLPPPTVAPTGLSAVTGHGQVVLSWNSVANATSYNVKRSTVSGGGYATIASVTGTTYTDSTVTDGVAYYYVVSAASNIAETANSAEISATPSRLPQSWSNQDIGNTAFAGSSSVDSYGKYTVAGSGADIWNSADAFQFASIPWRGDGVLVARILDITNTSIYTKVGVMFRDTLLANSKNVFAGARGQGSFVEQVRSSTGGSSSNSGSTPSGSLPHWIKLVRSGNTFTAYHSGTTSPSWAALGSPATAVIGSNCYAGLAVSAHDNTKLCTAHFDNVIFLATPNFVTGTNQVILNWLSSTGADSYQVQRSAVSGSNYTTIATLTGTTSYTDPGLTSGSTYYYVITAIGDQGMSATSPQATVQPGVLNVPAGLSAAPGYSQATLSWNGATGAVSYNIKRSLTSGSNYSTIASVTGTSFVDSTVSNGTTYYYVVSAVSSWAAESANSSEVNAAVGPLQNTGFESPALASGTYSYNPSGGSWTFMAQSSTNGSGVASNNSNFTKYNAVAPEGTQAAFIQGTGTFYQQVNGLIPGASYTLTFAASERQNSNHTSQSQTFQIKLDSTLLRSFAPGATGSGTTAIITGSAYTDYSLSLTATTSSQVLKFVGTNTAGGDNSIFIDNIRFVLQSPSSPTALTVTSDGGQPTLNWNAVSGASSYNAKRSLNRSSGYTVIATGLTSPSYPDPIDSSSTMYYYKVSAVNAAGESADSTVAAAPLITVPTADLMIEATSAGGATVNFNTSAIDVSGSSIPTTDNPASGTIFPLGDTPVTTYATDGVGSSGTAYFTVSVIDTTPPAITTGGDITAEATGSYGAVVNFAPTAYDLVSGTVPATCSPQSGTIFALGTTAVIVTATDTLGNTGTSSFNVNVVDTTPPYINAPSAVYIDATGTDGAVVNFTTSANDLVSGTVPTYTSLASGSLFPIGTTTVTVTATDGAGNQGSKSFPVTVFPLPTVKADNNVVLSQTNSWTGGKVPSSSDTALWSGTYAASSGTATIGSGLTVDRIRIGTISRSISIGAASGSLSLLGVSGTSIDMSAASSDLTIACYVSLSSVQTWTLAPGRTLTISGKISESTPGSGVTISGSGTTVFSGSNNFTGPTTVSSGATLTNNNTVPGNLIINSGTGPASPNANSSPVIPTGVAQLNAGSSTGPITNNGQLTLSGSLPFNSIGLITGSGSNGGINDKSSAAKTLTFADGSAFAYYQSSAGAGKTTPVTFQVAGKGATYFRWFGYNNSSSAISGTFNGGTFNIANAGQNNSNTDFLGTMTVANGSAVNITNNVKWVQGTWLVTNGSLTISNGADSITNSHGTLSMALSVDNSGGGTGSLLTNPTGGLNLYTAISGTVAPNNSLTVGPGGTASFANVVSLGNSIAWTSSTAELNTITVNGGLFSVSGNGVILNTGTTTAAYQTNTFTISSGTASITSLVIGSNYNASSNTVSNTLNLSGGKLVVQNQIQAGTGGNQANSFNWTGGQLSAGTIIPSAGFAGTNSSISGNTLTNTAGVLAPGDTGSAGSTLISGNYTAKPGSTLAIDIGGPNQSTDYDYLSITGSTTLSGTLAVTLVNNFVPTSAQSFTILSSSNALTGTFANLTGTSRVITTNGAGAFLVSATANKIVLSNYTAITPPVITASPASMTVTQGYPVTLTVSASTSTVTPTLYQWRLNGAPIAGATASAYSLASPQFTDSGSYDVVVSNSAGSATSSPATLTVAPAPVPPTGLTATAGNATVSISWNSVNGAVSYNVKRGTTSDSYSNMFTGIPSSSFLDNTVSNGITYYYIVTMLNAAGTESSPSSEASAHPCLPFGATELWAPAMALSGSNARVTLTSVPAHTYQLQRCDALETGSWYNVGSPVTGTGASINLTDPSVPTGPRRFYRVLITK